jgi:sporulation protein YlmC with PRC-barrel domain
MTSHALRPPPRRIRRRTLVQRRRRRLDADGRLLSVAGAVGAFVHANDGRRVGLLQDLVVRVGDETYPPLVEAVIRSPRGRTAVPVESIREILPGRLLLAGALEHRPVERKPGLVALAHDVLDRQIVDVDGAYVVRVSDLVLGHHEDGLHLVGVDVSIRTLLRRLGWPGLRRRVAPPRLYDWAAVAAFSERVAADAGSVLHLTNAVSALRERGPANLDALLGDLPPHERALLTERGSGSA